MRLPAADRHRRVGVRPSRQFGSLFVLQATAQPGQDLAAVEAVLDEELGAFLKPIGMALRVFPRLLYGEGHAYGQPLSGSGTEATLNALTLDGLREFHDTWSRPDNATLVVVGDITLAEAEPALEARFAGWESGEVPGKNVGEVDHQAGTRRLPHRSPRLRAIHHLRRPRRAAPGRPPQPADRGDEQRPRRGFRGAST